MYIYIYIYIYIYVPDQFGTLAQVGTSPNLGWPNKELRGSQPIYELFCPSWDPLGIPMKQSRVVMLELVNGAMFCLEMQLSGIKFQQFTGSLTHILMWE